MAVLSAFNSAELVYLLYPACLIKINDVAALHELLTHAPTRDPVVDGVGAYRTISQELEMIPMRCRGFGCRSVWLAVVIAAGDRSTPSLVYGHKRLAGVAIDAGRRAPHEGL